MEEMSYVLTKHFLLGFMFPFFSLPLISNLPAAGISHFLPAAIKFPGCFSTYRFIFLFSLARFRIMYEWMSFIRGNKTRYLYIRLDFRRLPGPVFDARDDPRGMSAGSFSRTAAGNRAYLYILTVSSDLAYKASLAAAISLFMSLL